MVLLVTCVEKFSLKKTLEATHSGDGVDDGGAVEEERGGGRRLAGVVGVLGRDVEGVVDAGREQVAEHQLRRPRHHLRRRRRRRHVDPVQQHDAVRLDRRVPVDLRAQESHPTNL